MKHKFSFNLKSRFVILLIGLLTMSATSAWGGTATIATKDLPTSYSTGDKTVDEITYYVSNVANYGNGMQFRSTPGYIYNKTELPNITNIELTTQSGKTGSFNITVGSSQNPSTNSKTITNGKSYSDVPANCGYFKVTSSGTAYIASIIVTYGSAEKYTVTYHVAATSSSVKDVVSGTTVSSALSGVTTTSCSAESDTFVGWSTAAIDGSTDEKPSTLLEATAKVTSDMEVWAVWAKAEGSDPVQKTTTLNLKQSSAPTSPWTDTNTGAVWTFSGLTFSNSNSAGMPNGSWAQVVFPSNSTAVTMTENGAGNSWSTSNITLSLYAGDKSTAVKTFNDKGKSYTFTNSDNAEGKYKLSSVTKSSKVAYVGSIVYEFTVGGTTYSKYITSCSAPTKTTIIYDANGVTGYSGTLPAQTQVNVGASVDLTATLSHSLYTFKGWNTDKEATEGLSSATAEGASMTFYAIWQAKEIQELTKSGTLAKSNYYEDESFDPTGLTIYAKYDESTSVDVTSQVTWNPNPLTQGTTSVTGSYGGKQIVVDGITVTKPIIVTLDKDNTPFEATSAITTGGTKTVNDIEYSFLAGYNYNSYLALNRSKSGAYIGNNTAFCGNIEKIVVSLAADVKTNLTMYEGTSALAETSSVSASDYTDNVATYIFSGNTAHFKLKLTTTISSGSKYININYIKIYLKPCITTLSFDLNGGTGIVPADVTEFPATFPAVDGFTKANYHATGWNSQADGQGTHKNVGDEYTPTKSEKWYVEWKLNQYEVKWNVPGKATVTQTVDHGSDLTIPAEVVTDIQCYGKVFVGWTESATYSDPSVAPSDLFTTASGTVTAAKTFYAVYAKANQVGEGGAVVLPNSAISGLGSTTWAYDDTGKTIVINDTTWTFDGTYHGNNVAWLQLGQIKGLVHTPTCPNNITSIVVNCMGSADKYLQLYNGSSKVGEAKATPTTDGDVTLSVSGPYTQLNIANHDNTGAYSGSKNAININSITVNYGPNITYSNYATTCEAPSKTEISYNKNTTAEVTGEVPATVEQENGVAYTVSTATLTRTGYNFVGWNTNAQATEKLTTIPATQITGEPITLYAIWSAKSYDVTFNANATDATGEMAAQSIPYETSANLTANAFSRTGYTFAGWATTSDGEVAYSDKAEYTMATEGATLYAVWTANKHKVTYVLGEDASGCANIAEQAYGTKVTVCTTAIKSHHTVSSWTTVPSDLVISDGKFTMPDEDVTLTAVWAEAQKVTVKFMNNGEEVSSKPVYVGEAIGDLPTQALTACDETSTSFIGWTAAEISIKQDDQPALISAETVIENASVNPVIYNALWAKNVGVASTNYAKITSMDALTDNNYVFAYDYYGGTQIVMKNTSSTSGKIDGYNLSLSSSKYANPDAAYIWRIKKVVDGSNTYYTLYNNSVSKYASANSSGVSLTDAACNYIVTWDNSNSCFRFQPKDASTYYLCGYVSGSTYYFQSSTSGGGDRYHVHLYKNESTTSYTEYLTKCCTKWTAPAFDYETKTIAVGAGTLTPTIGEGTTHGALSFASSDETIATVNASTGVLTPVKPGEVYVVATWEGADGYCAASDTSSTITVTGTLTIQFYKNGEDVTGTMENQEVTYNQATELKKNTYARTGYTFDGWKEQGGTTTYDDEQVVTFTTDMKLDAQWTINQHSVSFTNSYEGGTLTVNGESASPVEDIDYNSEVTIAVTENTHYHLTALSYQIGSETPVEIDLTTKKFNMPDADVTVMATFTEDTKRTVTWYAGKTSSTTENVYDGTLFSALTAPEVDDDAAGDCADKFMGWATEAITTPLDEAGFNAIKVNETTAVSESQNAFYAVFASASSAGAAAVNTVLWGENFAHFGTSNPSVAGIGSGTTKYGNDTIIYSQNDDGTKAYAETSAGGTSPELLLKSGKTWTISGIKTGKAKAMALSFLSNKTTFAVTTTSSDIEVSGEAKAWTFTVKAGKVVETFDITIKNNESKNARIDNVSLKVSESGVSYSDYITKCCDKLEAPASIEATDKTSSSLTFSWGTVANATGYQYKIDNAEWSEVQTTTTATATDLVENQIIHVLARGVYSGSENYCAEGDTAVANLKLVTVVKQPDTIEVTTNPTKMVYAVGESFDPAGMAVKVTYNTGETSTDVAYTYSPITAFTEAGEQTITIRYSLNEKEVQTTLDVTVKNKYTVEWKVNGTTTSTTADVLDGTLYSELTKPTNPEATAFAACEANTFMGWAKAAVTKEGATADDVAFAEDDTEITNEVHVFYAVFAKEQTSQKVAKTVDLVASDGAYNTTNKDITFSALNGKITLTQIKATSSNDVNSTYSKKGTDSNRPRVYNGQTIKIVGTSGFTFTNVEIGHSGEKYGASLKANVVINDGGSVTDSTAAVTKTTSTTSGGTQTFALAAEGDSLFIQNGGSTQWHLKSVVVSYMDGGETEYVNYMTTCKTATKLDVKTAPTKVDYNEEETLDLTGLELTVTYDDASSETITSGYTSDPENGAVLSNETEVTLSYKGQECKQAITVTPLTRSTISATAPVGGTYTVKVGDAEAQTITEATNITEVKAGRTITLTTTASEHYKLAATPFVVKDADNADVELTKSGSNYTFTMPAKNVTISAQYVQLFTITKADVTGGTLTIKDNVTEAAEGTSIIVNATAAAGNELTALYYIKQGEETKNAIDLTTKTFTMVASNITVYATFTAKSYTITLNNKGVETQVTDLTYNETYTFEPGTTCPEYEFFGWSETAPEEGAWTEKPVVVTEYKVVEDKTFYAVYRQAGEPTLGDNYLLVNGSEDFESGKNYIITTISGEDELAMSNSFTEAHHSYSIYANFASVAVTPVNDVIQGTAATIWKLTGDATNGYTIYNAAESKYVGADYSEQDLAFTATEGYIIPFTITFPNEKKPEPTVEVSFYQNYVGSNSHYLTKSEFNSDFEIGEYEGNNYLYKQQYDTAFTYLAVPSCKELASVEVLTAPDKVNYKAGEDFDKTGLSLTATFTDASEELVEEDNIVIEGGEALAISATEVTAKYTYDNITKSTSVAINMIELKSIAMNSASAHKTDYKVGQTFNPKNLIIDAHYNTTGSTLTEDVIEQVTEGFTYEPTTGLVEGENTITISYQGKTTTTTVNATPASPATVIFAASNESQYTETETSVGAGVKVPSVKACSDYTFLGWTDEEISGTTSTAPTMIEVSEGRYYPEEDMVLYPVFKGYDNPMLYKRATDVTDLADGMKILIYNNTAAKTLGAGNSVTYASALPAETNNQITVTDDRTLWKLTATGENVYKLQYEDNTLGVETLPTSSNTAVSYTTDNSEWTISKYSNNAFHIKQGDVYLEVYSNNWVAYYTTNAGNGYIQNRIYVPAGNMIYTSAPSTCTVEVEQSVVTLNAANGELDEDEFILLKGESLDLPTPTFSCNGWSFAGWTASDAITTETTTAPEFVASPYTPTEDITFNAVYTRTLGETASYKTTASCATMPSFSVEAGQYTEPKTIVLSATDATLGDAEEIRYTIDGSVPTASSMLYESPIELKDSTTIKAIALYMDLQTNIIESDYSQATYTFTKPDAPEFSVAAGNVVENTTVTISSAEGTNVMYKIGDAEYVTAETNSYTYTFASLGAVTIKAKATKGGLESDEESRAYTVVAKPYTVTFNAGAGLIDGESTKEITETAQGKGVKLPVPTDPCTEDTWVFYGWSETNQTEDVTTAPALVAYNDYGSYKQYYPSADITLYAIYAKKQGGTILLEESCQNLTIAEGNNFVASNNAYMSDSEREGGVRIGTKDNAGYIKTKAFNVPVGSALTFTFDYKAWKDQDYANFQIAEVDGASTTYTGSNYTSYELAQSVSLTTTQSNPRFTFTSAKNQTYRSFLRNIVISMGEVTAHYQTSPICCVNSVVYNVGEGGVAIDPVKVPCNTGKFITLPKAEKLNCEFIKWTMGGNDYAAGDVYEYAATQSGDVEFVAVFGEPVTEITIEDDQDVKASDVLPSGFNGKLIVKDGAIITMDQPFSIGDFVIESSIGTSGQVKGGMNLTITGDAYMELTIDTAAAGASFGWYAFTVPFPVSGSAGIYYGDKKLQAEKDYSVMKYLGDVRAQGKYGWKKCQGETLQPGVFYLLAVADTDYKTLRFHLQKSGASYTIEAAATKPDGTSNTCRTNVYQYAASGSGEATDAGWNGVGNKTLEYVSVTDNDKIADELQTYDNSTKAFKTYASSAVTFSVGKPCFVQASGDGDFSFSSTNHATILAPARTTANASEKILVTLSDNAYTDNLFISASEEALPQYEITRDLAKMAATGTVSVPQIATKNYGVDLCVEYAPLTDDEATYALSLYAPKAGEYTIAATQVEGCELFLTKNGEVIWNLSMSDYTVDLTKGNTDTYGLVLKVDHKLPTDVQMQNAQGTMQGVQKFIYDEKLIIIRDGKTYDAQGRRR